MSDIKKGELIELLRENLSLDINTETDYGYGGLDKFLVIKLKIDDQIIAQDRVRIGATGDDYGSGDDYGF